MKRPIKQQPVSDLRDAAKWTLLSAWTRTDMIGCGGTNAVMSRNVYQSVPKPEQYLLDESYACSPPRAWLCSLDAVQDELRDERARQDRLNGVPLPPTPRYA
jgi:hypothetical protein